MCKRYCLPIANQQSLSIISENRMASLPLIMGKNEYGKEAVVIIMHFLSIYFRSLLFPGFHCKLQPGSGCPFQVYSGRV